MKRLGALLLLFVAAPVFAAATAWTPFEIEGGQIYLNVTLNGHPARALLDTGALVNKISAEFIDENAIDYERGPRVSTVGPSGKGTANVVDGVSIGMFGVELEIDHLLPYDNSDVEFVIGLPVFKTFVVQIDYPGRRIRLISHDSVDMKAFENVRMQRSSGEKPVVQVDLNGEDRPWLLFDISSISGVLYRRIRAEERGWLERYSTESPIEGDAVEFRLPTLKIGPYTLENVLINVPEEGGRISYQPWNSGELTTGTRVGRKEPVDGVLGYDVLKHFIVTIDYKRSLLNLDVPQ